MDSHLAVPVRRHRPLPWVTEPAPFLDSLRHLIPFDTLALGVLQQPQPRLDGLLAIEHLPPTTLAAWYESGHARDALLKTVLQQGLATAAPGIQHPQSTLALDRHVLMVALPETPASWWWILLARRDRGFSDLEKQATRLLLRDWQTQFLQPEERHMGHLLVGHDQRLLLADLNSQFRLLRNPNLVQQLLIAMHPIIQQRYPHLADGQAHDIALTLEEHPTWVVARRRHALDLPTAYNWYIELRPLEAEELPPIGTVEDERIAQAIAYLHEQYSQAPSLAEIAHSVHVSPFHFHRLFSQQVGISPKHYLQRKQLQVAKWLLRKGGMPIGAIARETGFSSHGHFTSTFHRLVGMSPSDYRDKHA